jgi:hypothetical protein
MALIDQNFNPHKPPERPESAVIKVYVEFCSKILQSVSTEFYYDSMPDVGLVIVKVGGSRLI